MVAIWVGTKIDCVGPSPLFGRLPFGPIPPLTENYNAQVSFFDFFATTRYPYGFLTSRWVRLELLKMRLMPPAKVLRLKDTLQACRDAGQARGWMSRRVCEK